MRLAIYLNDHLAGSTAGVELARRLHGQNRGSEYEQPLGELAAEIAEDRTTLLTIMERLDIGRDRLKVAGAWAGEKLGRLKLNGQLTGYSPLSRLVELEGLETGINGKRAMWAALEHVAEARVPGFDFADLRRRAERQAAEVEERRLEAAETALASSTKLT
jgi:hypothetical protein